ncbi:MAG: hypothetical protein U0414_25150 [Polyangiaceae bacterium]
MAPPTASAGSGDGPVSAGAWRSCVAAVVLGAAGCKPETKITDDVIAAAREIAALPEAERGDLVFEPALGVYKAYGYLEPKGWERDYGDVFHSTPLRATYAVKHECPEPSCTSRTESEWRVWAKDAFDLSKPGGTGQGSSVEDSPAGTFVIRVTTGVSTRDGSNGRERIVVAKWPVEGQSQKITICEVVVDFDGEPRKSPKRAVLGALEKACRAVHPFF